MKLGFSTNAFTNYSLFNSIELISKIGYDGIEIVLDEPHAFLPLSKNRISEIKNSILLNNAKAAHFAYIGDSILGNNVNIGAGVKCANFKLKRSSIVLYIDGKAIDTGLMKLGSIIGDNSQIGCNSVANPGTIIGKNCI